MDTAERRTELGAFLKAGRAAITPESAGLPRGRRRLTPGLKREEVAFLAGIGVTWYTWLEQGREINVSAAAIGRIARALRLSATDEAYVFLMAGIEPPTDKSFDPAVPAQVQTVLDLFQAPGFVIDPPFNIVAFNALADALYDFDAGLAPFPRNHLWNGFMNPRRQGLYVDWEDEVQHISAGALRLAYANHPNDPRFEALLAALLEDCPVFARLWNERKTSQLTPPRTRLTHPDFGDIAVAPQIYPIRETADYQLVLLPPADAGTAAAFARMAKRLGRAGSRR